MLPVPLLLDLNCPPAVSKEMRFLSSGKNNAYLSEPVNDSFITLATREGWKIKHTASFTAFVVSITGQEYSA